VKIKDPWILPYGIYLDRNFVTFFDRRYRPIVTGPWINYVYYEQSQAITVNSFVPIAPDTRINFEAQRWLYNDGNSPTHSPKKRSELKKLVLSIPVLAAEIERRNTKAVRA
jgi:hypothetical protein